MSFFASHPGPAQAESKAMPVGCPRAAMVVYRHLLGQPHFLLIGTRRQNDRLTLPGGKIDADESALETAIRETIEEAGVMTDRHLELDSYAHQKTSGRVHPTKTFLARYVGYGTGHEARELCWLTLSELTARSQTIRQPIREQIERAAEVLPTLFAAA